MFCRYIQKICTVKVTCKYLKRLLLTGAYSCNEVWNERLKDIDCKISANELSIKLQNCLSSDVAISALDFDILMNKVNEIDIMNLDYITKLVRNFRETQESIKCFESSSHALIRNLVDLDEPFQAYNLIRDRQNSGIFLDEVSVNLLLDKFITEKNWEKAFFTSAEWLLQENYDCSKLSLSLSLISCLNFWRDKLWQYQPPVVDVSNLPEEIVFVQYLKNNSFDDHFDLTDDKYRRRLLGKCLCMLADCVGDGINKDEEYITRNLKLLGLALHEKLTAVINHLESWLQVGDVKLNEFMITEIAEWFTTSERTDPQKPVIHPTYKEDEIIQLTEQYQNLVQSFRERGKVDNENLIDFCLSYISDKVSKQSDQETDLVRQKYTEFNEKRRNVFEKTKQKMLTKSILEKSKKKLLELTEQEELISYFEQMPEIMYKSWLAKRTKEEKEFSTEKDEQENLDNMKKKEKQRFVIQHVVE